MLYFKVFGLYPCKSIFAIALGKTDFINEVVISYEGNEFDATYIFSFESL